MHYEKEIQNLQLLGKAIDDLAPRNSDGELLWPYRGWRERIVNDIAKWARWKDSSTSVSTPRPPITE